MQSLDDIRQVLTLARKAGMAEVEYETNGHAFKAELMPVAHPTPGPNPLVSEHAAIEDRTEVTLSVVAPCVGYFKEGDQPIKVGQRVQKGDAVAVISALGLANQVESTQTGEVSEVCVRNGDPVQYGQVLFKVIP